jgi:hypothetical protein
MVVGYAPDAVDVLLQEQLVMNWLGSPLAPSTCDSLALL